MQFVPGPDFPTGGIVVDDKAAIAEAYATGRGSFRVRARWHKEDQGRGVYSIVITEIPYLVQKSRLIEKIAELLNDRKLPLVADVRDKSTEDVRADHRAEIARGRRDAVDGIAVQADRARKPRSAQHERAGEGPRSDASSASPKRCESGSITAATSWCAARKHRLAAIDHRLEVLGGLLVAYLNLDKVIKIIRTAGRAEARPDEDVQDHRRAGRRHPQHAAAQFAQARGNGDQDRGQGAARRAQEAQSLARLRGDQWKTISAEIKEMRELFGPKTKLGKRRTSFGEAPEHDAAAIEEALVEREPVTIVVSEKGWVRALRGHVSDLSGVTFKTDDALKFAFPAETTSRCSVVRDQRPLLHPRCRQAPGRARTSANRYASSSTWSRTPKSCRYSGIRAARNSWSQASRAAASSFVEDDCVANTRKGKQVLNVKPKDGAVAIASVEGDLIAAIGKNRKMVIFPISDVPEMGRGSGVRLQRYKDGGLSDVTTFVGKDGLTWLDGAGRAFTMTLKELSDWRGKRADAGRLAPKGFPKSNNFGRKI